MENEPILMEKKYSESDDSRRFEEPWDSTNEKFMENIRQTSVVLSNKHMAACKRNKKKYIILSLPTGILPIILANLSIFISNMSVYIIPITLTIIAILNSVALLFNYSQRTEQHNNYAGKYDDVAKKIDSILIRNRRYRQPFDILLSEITEIKRSIDSSAPLL
jgi:hypothetical protein